MPKLGTTELESYGMDSVNTLLSHYGESKPATYTSLDGKDYDKEPIVSEDIHFECKTCRQYMSQKSASADIRDLVTNETLVITMYMSKLTKAC